MRIRFQADADLDGRVIRGLKRRSPEIDIRWAANAGFVGVADPEVLRISAESERILVSQDRRTMPAYFARHIATAHSPGVILLRETVSIALAIDELLLIWTASGGGMDRPLGVDSSLKEIGYEHLRNIVEPEVSKVR